MHAASVDRVIHTCYCYGSFTLLFKLIRPKKKNDGVAATRPTLIICHDPKVFGMFNKKKYCSPTSDPKLKM